jgi:hypothetical protein
MRRKASSRALPPPCDRDTEQESDKQAGKRRLSRDRAESSQRFPGLPRRRDRGTKTIEGSLKRCGYFGDGARNVSRRVDGAFGHAGLQRC